MDAKVSGGDPFPNTGSQFEELLSNEGFIPQPGIAARLGELLVGADVIDKEALDNLLAVADQTAMPLGRTLICVQAVEPDLIVRALKLQSLVRLQKITVESALLKLKRASRQRLTRPPYKPSGGGNSAK